MVIVVIIDSFRIIVVVASFVHFTVSSVGIDLRTDFVGVTAIYLVIKQVIEAFIASNLGIIT